MSKRTLISVVAAGAALSIGAAIWAANKPAGADRPHCANCANAANPCNPCGAKVANPCNPCSGKTADIRNLNLDKNAVALSGYDAVSYFSGDKPARGDARFTAEHKGVKYQFANQKNLETFKAGAEKYVPAFGGWCAYAMADGRKVEVDPVNFKIKDGQLLLFYRDFITNTLTKWNKSEDDLYSKAQANWAKLTAVTPAPSSRPSAAGNPCNPCSGKKAANPCNPCSKKAENPCGGKAQNPCGGK